MLACLYLAVAIRIWMWLVKGKPLVPVFRVKKVCAAFLVLHAPLAKQLVQFDIGDTEA